MSSLNECRTTKMHKGPAHAKHYTLKINETTDRDPSEATYYFSTLSDVSLHFTDVSLVLTGISLVQSSFTIRTLKKRKKGKMMFAKQHDQCMTPDTVCRKW